MFTLNKQTKTKTNKLVIPYSVDGENVYCFDINNKTIILNIKDFDLNNKEQKKDVFVRPKQKELVIIEKVISQESITDELFEEVEDDELFEEVEDNDLIKGEDNSNGYIPDEEYV